jgi:hypothetical protein
MAISDKLGYKKSTIEKLFKKHKNKKLLKDATTFEPEKEDIKRIRLPFYPPITNKISAIFRKYDIQAVLCNDNKIKNLLGNTKDKDKPEDCSGIYKINCQNCRGVYIGQTRRNIKTRFKEHIYYSNYKIENKSALSDHLIQTNHKVDFSNLNLIQKVNKPSQLNIKEAIAMKKNKNILINNDLTPLENILLKVINTKSDYVTNITQFGPRPSPS